MSSDGTTLKRALKYEKGLTRPKDASAPKRPLSAYFQWAGENRERVQSESNLLTLAEVAKKLGEMWRELSAEDKSGYEEKAKSEMEAYKTKFEKYKTTKKYEAHDKNLVEFNIKMTYKPFGKDENMPKRAQTGYLLFAAAERPKISLENDGKKVTEIMALVAKAWKELSEDEKIPYNDKAKKLADKHAKTMDSYKKSSKHLKYLEEKKEYAVKMEAKRKRLMKQAGLEAEDGKGSGATPKKKRAKKPSEPKKKKSAPKKASAKKKTNPKKKSNAKKKSSVKKSKVSIKKGSKGSKKK